MKPSCLRRFCSVGLGVTLAAVICGLLAGCGNLFVARHKVLVDAISAPGVEKPTGLSYRLLAKPAVMSTRSVQVPVVKACIDAALAGQGLYEPPANVAPDIFIEVTFGRDASARVDASARETFLQLSARANTNRALDRATGPELWDVRVALLGVAGPVETAMPLLATVAAMNLATNTGVETKLDIPQNSPMVEAVRTSAIKSLEAKAQTAAAPAAPTPPAGSGTASPPTPPGSPPSARFDAEAMPTGARTAGTTPAPVGSSPAR